MIGVAGALPPGTRHEIDCRTIIEHLRLGDVNCHWDGMEGTGEART